MSRFRILRRQRIPYWVAAGGIALLTTVVVARLTSDAAAERARWGDGRGAVVVTSAVRAGARLAGHAEARRLPAAVVPDGALTSLPAGAIAAVDLAPGEIVLPSRIGGGGRVPPGTRGIAVPVADGLSLSPGDRVDVLATFDVKSSGGPPTVVVARDASVLRVSKNAATVAVPEDTAPKVAYALAAGTVTLVLSG